MKSQAGKLLIIGGNAHGFAAAAESYAEAVKAGAGSVRVLLPDVLRKTVGKVFEAGEFVPSTPSGSFSMKALAEIIDSAAWADSVILAGDFGHNSETAILLENFLTKSTAPVTLAQDGLAYFTKTPLSILERPNTLLAAEFTQLQKLATTVRFPKAFTSDMDLLRLVDQLHEFSLAYPAFIVVRHLNNDFVAVSGRLSTTNTKEEFSSWSITAATHACVWLMQNPAKPFEAITSALVAKV